MAIATALDTERKTLNVEARKLKNKQNQLRQTEYLLNTNKSTQDIVEECNQIEIPVFFYCLYTFSASFLLNRSDLHVLFM